MSDPLPVSLPAPPAASCPTPHDGFTFSATMFNPPSATVPTGGFLDV